jgi:carbamate kinase
VIRNAAGDYVGVEAVIDKDRTGALLAAAIGAATFLIVTNIERVAINFGKPDERRLERLSLAEARRHLAAGQFPPGSMGPKIEAAIDFLECAPRADAAVIVCDLACMAEALAGRSGTWITRDG